MILFYAALALLSMGRVLPHFQESAFTISPYDFGNNLWRFWWGPFSFYNGLNPYFTQWQFHPFGAPLTVNFSLMDYFFTVPLSGLLNPVGLYNLTLTLTYVFTGVLSFHLFYFFSKHDRGALLASVFVTFSPFKNYHVLVSGSEVAQTHWPILLLLAYFLIYFNDTWGWKALWALPAVFPAIYHEQRTLMMAVLFLTVVTFVDIVEKAVRRDPVWKKRLAKYLVFCAGAAVLSLPLLWEYLRVFGDWNGASSPGIHVGGWKQIFLWPAHYFLRFESGNGELLFERNAVYLNVFAMGLAVLGALKARALAGRFGFIVGFFVFLGFALGYWSLSGLPMVGYLKAPARYAFIVSLVVGLFLACGWRAFETMFRPKALRGVLYGALMVLFFVETNPLFCGPFDIKKSAALEELRKNTERGAVLDLPFGIAPRVVGRFYYKSLLRATQHEKPVMNGFIAWLDIATRKKAKAGPFHRAIAGCEFEGRCEAVGDEFWRKLATGWGVKYVICDNGFENDPLIARVRTSPVFERVASEAEFDLYVFKAAGKTRKKGSEGE
ncbi:MAG TPA: hypothetical protein P5079_09305 [Elusimicrobiota bacterium]|nr:hypothetical protein [Elusimicrobiota bacterium]